MELQRVVIIDNDRIQVVQAKMTSDGKSLDSEAAIVSEAPDLDVKVLLDVAAKCSNTTERPTALAVPWPSGVFVFKFALEREGLECPKWNPVRKNNCISWSLEKADSARSSSKRSSSRLLSATLMVVAENIKSEIRELLGTAAPQKHI